MNFQMVGQVGFKSEASVKYFYPIKLTILYHMPLVKLKINLQKMKSLLAKIIQKMHAIFQFFKNKLPHWSASHKSDIWLLSMNNNKNIFGQFLSLSTLPSNKTVVAKIKFYQIFCHTSRIKVPVAYPNNPETHFPKRQTKM